MIMKYEDKDVEMLRDHGIEIKVLKGRTYAEFDTPDYSKGRLGEKVKFRTDYADQSGDIEVLLQDKKTKMRYSSYKPDEILDLCEGKAVSVDYMTTSDVRRQERQMLGVNVGQFNKVAIRPMTVDKIGGDRNSMLFAPSVYDKEVQVQRKAVQEYAAKAVSEVMQKAAAFEDYDPMKTSEDIYSMS